MSSAADAGLESDQVVSTGRNDTVWIEHILEPRDQMPVRRRRVHNAAHGLNAGAVKNESLLHVTRHQFVHGPMRLFDLFAVIPREHDVDDRLESRDVGHSGPARRNSIRATSWAPLCRR